MVIIEVVDVLDNDIIDELENLIIELIVALDDEGGDIVELDEIEIIMLILFDELELLIGCG